MAKSIYHLICLSLITVLLCSYGPPVTKHKNTKANNLYDTLNLVDEAKTRYIHAKIFVTEMAIKSDTTPTYALVVQVEDLVKNQFSTFVVDSLLEVNKFIGASVREDDIIEYSWGYKTIPKHSGMLHLGRITRYQITTDEFKPVD